MKIICPNDETHKQFSVTAHVTELWGVDEAGYWQETICTGDDVVHRPDSDDLFKCRVCGVQAEVSE